MTDLSAGNQCNYMGDAHGVREVSSAMSAEREPRGSIEYGERWTVDSDSLCRASGEDAACTAGQPPQRRGPVVGDPGEEAGAPILRGAGQADAVGAEGGSIVAEARAERYQMSQAGVVQRKRVEVTLTRQISTSVARMSRARNARSLRERVA